ncbi:Type VI secretion system-associated protein [Candidatus Methylobacter favarea]|uniref:Type VI secretion system-associated protein n=1 Tax=Candidatus Methylobacter favarea TaxID=2707345 RepID=A0A8S0XHG3_9GAMM|nr:type VI secretion system-associated protein TagF [Candidatus Methylobacter favarea]CAA9889691.1 Type VI secretion system-associated protein [Candidatus Methylobacter favarea]
MPDESLELGYYGKVHTHGDFVSRGLPRSFIEPWDAWLQKAIITSRQQLGENWINYYLTSPLYRFVLSPGICGEAGWLGVLMPSVDRIGRYYPMTISVMNTQNINPFLVFKHKKQWFINIERLVLSCLTDHFNLDHFNLSLSQLKSERGCIIAYPKKTIVAMKDQPVHIAWQYSINSIEPLPNLMPCLLNNLLKKHCFSYSVWWTQGSEVVSQSLLISTGLPHFEGMAAMFDGNWQKWGWESKSYPL